MKKIVIFLLISFEIFLLNANTLQFDGDIVSVEYVSSESFKIMVNNDYDFLYYLITCENNELKAKELTITKKDITNNLTQIINDNNLKLEEELLTNKTISRKIEKQKRKYQRTSNIINMECIYFSKNKDSILLILSFNDGQWEFNSILLEQKKGRIQIKDYPGRVLYVFNHENAIVQVLNNTKEGKSIISLSN